MKSNGAKIMICLNMREQMPCRKACKGARFRLNSLAGTYRRGRRESGCGRQSYCGVCGCVGVCVCVRHSYCIIYLLYTCHGFVLAGMGQWTGASTPPAM